LEDWILAHARENKFVNNRFGVSLPCHHKSS
jgi:hypothetical protein